MTAVKSISTFKSLSTPAECFSWRRMLFALLICLPHHAWCQSADSDGDGVRDAVDLCPETVAGSSVENNGCVNLNEIDLSNVPLEIISASTEPNVVVVMDDSGSMGSEQVINQSLQGSQASWRGQSADFNQIFYNPKILYLPWPTRNNASLGNSVVNDAYYLWNDLNGNNLLDENEGTPITIRPGATFQGSNERSDCAQAPVCSHEEELQNYRNWETYYKNRQNTAISALSLVVNELQGVSLSIDRLNRRNTSGFARLAGTGIDNARRQILNDIITTPARGGTPLRPALVRAGNTFQCTPGSANCPVKSAQEGGACQQNFAVLISDGFWNGSVTNIGNADGDNNSQFDGSNFQDNVANTLADIAMHFYETDLQPGIENLVPLSTIETKRFAGAIKPTSLHQHMVTFTVGFGLSGLIEIPNNLTTPIDWGNPLTNSRLRVDDMLHAAYNGRGDFYSANNPVELINNFETIFESIRASTGSATALSFNSQKLKTNDRVYSASYDTGTMRGDLIARGVDKKSGLLNGIIHWSAANELENIAPNERNIVTYLRDKKDAKNNRGIPFRFAELTGTLQGRLQKQEIDYIRGSRDREPPKGKFREREAPGGLLGTIINGSPVFVGPAPFSRIKRDRSPFPTQAGKRYSEFVDQNKRRPGIVYVAANDGMLHGFDADDGKEVIAYVPATTYMQDDKTRNLANYADRAFSHQLFVDAPPLINDVFIKTRSQSNRQWHTLLFGGLGGGGKGVFALNVTNPQQFRTESEAAQEILWEFTDDDDPDLGFSFKPPMIAMTNEKQSDGENRWRAFLSNGYNSRTGKALLYAMNLEGGLDGSWDEDGDLIKLDTGIGPDNNQVPNGLGEPRGVDSDGNGTVDRLYAADYQGNVYKIDVSNPNSKAWTIRKIYTAKDAFGNPQNIVSRPSVVRHPEDPKSLIVVFSTGSWIDKKDPLTTDVQTIYGIWDDGGASYTRANLVEQTYTDIKGDNFGDGRELSNNIIDWSTSKGWFIDLKNIPGERAIRDLVVKAGKGFVTTVSPGGACSTGGGAILSFDMETGGAKNGQPVFDINNDGVFNEQDNTDGTVAGLILDKIPGNIDFVDNRFYTPLSDGTIVTGLVGDPSLKKKGRISWRQIFGF